MASKMEISDIDFLNVIPEWDNSIDDLTLSQTCKDAENENTAFEKLEDLTLSQALDQYEVDFEMDDLPDFELTQVPLTADNIIEELEKAVTENCSENSRYSFVEDIDIDKLVKSTESRNTRKNTTWSVATFNDWRVARMKSNYCAIPELLQFTANDVNQWLSKFVIETRRKDGKPYPPKTLYLLCVGILRFHRENGVHMNFLDEKDCVFYDFRRSLSARMTELTKQGIGTTTKQAEAISEETESTLWEKGLLGSTSSKAIMNTMFFYNSKLFGLRGVDEHRNLSVDQFELGKDQTGSFILFKGRANKTYKGGLNQRNLSAKNLKHYLQNPVLFKIYEQYLNIVRDLNGTAFYRRPLDKGSIKFGEQSVGVNKLSNIMKTMCAEAGIDGYFTNHSGKRTCATTLYQAGVPEQEIMNRTGHRSVESVRKYKRASSEMLKDISNILEPSESMCKKIKHEDNTEIQNRTENQEISKSAAGGVGSLFTGCVFNFNSGS